MALGLGRWTVERVGSRVREMADSVREMADNLPRTQMPAVRMPPWVRLPEVKMTPAPRRGVHPLWVVAGGPAGARRLYFFLPEPGPQPRAGGGGKGPPHPRPTPPKGGGAPPPTLSPAPWPRR